ncbi:MAG: 4-fold beta flower protein [candidate division WOR-3 bacterium]
MNEEILYNRYGKAVYRVCGSTLYDFVGKPRGFLVGKTIYDTRGQLRGFYVDRVVWDRMGRVIGFAEGGKTDGLKFPEVEVPPVPYKNIPAPEPPSTAVDLACPNRVAAWSIMRLENLLV